LALKKNDDIMRNFRARKAENEQVTIGKNAISSVSQALYYAFGKAKSAKSPFLAFFKAIMLQPFKADAAKIPKLMFTILNGGKEL